MDKVNLAEKFARIDEVYKPKLVAEYNDNRILLTRAAASSCGTSTTTRTTCSRWRKDGW